MFRRKFITRLAMSGATTMATVGAANSKTVTYRIKGFTCVTCAVGLDSLLSKQEGVIRVHSSYPNSSTEIQFRPSRTNENALKEFISEMGFTAL
jgi:copper chaperone CopZ